MCFLFMNKSLHSVFIILFCFVFEKDIYVKVIEQIRMNAANLFNNILAI